MLVSFLVLGSTSCLTFPFASSNQKTNNDLRTIQVCQNKDCCQRWSMSYEQLPEILQDLLPPDVRDSVQVETSSCLSNCGKGPNMAVKRVGSKGFFLNGITGPMILRDELEERMDIKIPSKLVAAVTVIEKAQKVSLSEKNRLYSSVIGVLNSDALLSSSCAHARALVFRAQARHEEERYEEAIEDALLATRVPGATVSVASLAWRTLADCYRSQGQVESAIQALRQRAIVDPSYKTKIEKEIAQIKSL